MDFNSKNASKSVSGAPTATNHNLSRKNSDTSSLRKPQKKTTGDLNATKSSPSQQKRNSVEISSGSKEKEELDDTSVKSKEVKNSPEKTSTKLKKEKRGLFTVSLSPRGIYERFSKPYTGVFKTMTDFAGGARNYYKNTQTESTDSKVRAMINSSKAAIERTFINKVADKLRIPDDISLKIRKLVGQPKDIVKADAANAVAETGLQILEKAHVLQSFSDHTNERAATIGDCSEFLENLRGKNIEKTLLSKLQKQYTYAEERVKRVREIRNYINLHLQKMSETINKQIEAATARGDTQLADQLKNEVVDKLAAFFPNPPLQPNAVKDLDQFLKEVNRTEEELQEKMGHIMTQMTINKTDVADSKDLDNAINCIGAIEVAEKNLAGIFKEFSDPIDKAASLIHQSALHMHEENGVYIAKAVQVINDWKKKRAAENKQAFDQEWTTTNFFRHGGLGTGPGTGNVTVDGVWRDAKELWRINKDGQYEFRGDITLFTVDGKRILTTAKRIFNYYSTSDSTDLFISNHGIKLTNGERDKVVIIRVDRYDRKSQSGKPPKVYCSGEISKTEESTNCLTDENNEQNNKKSSFFKSAYNTIMGSSDSAISDTQSKDDEWHTGNEGNTIIKTRKDKQHRIIEKIALFSDGSKEHSYNKYDGDHFKQQVTITYDKDGQETLRTTLDYDAQGDLKQRKVVQHLNMLRVASIDITRMKKDLDHQETTLDIQEKTHSDEPVTRADADKNSNFQSLEEEMRRFGINALPTSEGGVEGGTFRLSDGTVLHLKKMDLTETSQDPELGTIFRDAKGNNFTIILEVSNRYVNDPQRRADREALARCATQRPLDIADRLIVALDTGVQSIYKPALDAVELLTADTENFKTKLLDTHFRGFPATDTDLDNLLTTWEKSSESLFKADPEITTRLEAIQEAVKDLSLIYQNEARLALESDDPNTARGELGKDIGAIAYTKQEVPDPTCGIDLLGKIADDAEQVAKCLGQDLEKARQEKIKEVQEIKVSTKKNGEELIRRARLENVRLRLAKAARERVKAGKIDSDDMARAKEEYIATSVYETLRKSFLKSLEKELTAGQKTEFDETIKTVWKNNADKRPTERNSAVVEAAIDKLCSLKADYGPSESDIDPLKKQGKETIEIKTKQFKEQWNTEDDWCKNYIAQWMFRQYEKKLTSWIDKANFSVNNAEERNKNRQAIAFCFASIVEAMAKSAPFLEGSTSAKAKDKEDQMSDGVQGMKKIIAKFKSNEDIDMGTIADLAKGADLCATKILVAHEKETFESKIEEIYAEIDKISENSQDKVQAVNDFAHRTLHAAMEGLEEQAKEMVMEHLQKSLNDAFAQKKENLYIKPVLIDAIANVHVAKDLNALNQSLQSVEGYETSEELRNCTKQIKEISHSILRLSIIPGHLAPDSEIESALFEQIQTIKANFDYKIEHLGKIGGTPEQYAEVAKKVVEDLTTLRNSHGSQASTSGESQPGFIQVEKSKLEGKLTGIKIEEISSSEDLKDKLTETQKAAAEKLIKDSVKTVLDLFMDYCQHRMGSSAKDQLAAQKLKGALEAQKNALLKNRLCATDAIADMRSDSLKTQKGANKHLTEWAHSSYDIAQGNRFAKPMQTLNDAVAELLLYLADKPHTETKPALLRLEAMLRQHDENCERMQVITASQDLPGNAEEIVKNICPPVDTWSPAPETKGDHDLPVPEMEATPEKRRQKVEKQLKEAQEQIQKLVNSSDRGEVVAGLSILNRDLARAAYQLEWELETNGVRLEYLHNNQEQWIKEFCKETLERFDKERQWNHQKEMKLLDKEIKEIDLKMLGESKDHQLKIFEKIYKAQMRVAFLQLLFNSLAGFGTMASGLATELNKLLKGGLTKAFA